MKDKKTRPNIIEAFNADINTPPAATSFAILASLWYLSVTKSTVFSMAVLNISATMTNDIDKINIIISNLFKLKRKLTINTATAIK